MGARTSVAIDHEGRSELVQELAHRFRRRMLRRAEVDENEVRAGTGGHGASVVDPYVRACRGGLIDNTGD